MLPNMDVDKNVKMGADLADNKDYKEIIEAVGLGEKLHKYSSELSGGEQQRVSVARALAKKPEELTMVFYNAQVSTAKVVCLVSGGCLLITSVVMLMFYIKHYIDTHKKELGILKALGYSNEKVMEHIEHKPETTSTLYASERYRAYSMEQLIELSV